MSKISLFIFIDALGWQILNEHPHFLKGLIREKKRLNTIFGYSSACDPSIISGRLPQDHKMWSSFYYSPGTCPYEWVKHLGWLPKQLTDSARVRNKLSQFIAKMHGFTGYFQIYNLPFEFLPLFDYAEKKWMWGAKGGMVSGTSIFDDLIDHNIPFYVKPSMHVSDQEQWTRAIDFVSKNKIEFAYLMLGKLDADMHAHGTDHPIVGKTIQQFDEMIRQLIATAAKYYEEVSWYVFSDHGMHDVQGGFDLQKEISELDLCYGTDYVALYDSTMARFWFLNDRARSAITEKLNALECGYIVPQEELQAFGTYFPDHQYGEVIFLMNSGILINPSFMGRKVIPGMHGFHPDDPESAAMICSNKSLPADLQGIEQIYQIMTDELAFNALKRV